jgi:pyruvate carboxylase
MIDPSLLYDDNYQPTSNSVVKHLQRANQSTTSKARNPDNKHDYVYVEHNRLEVAEEIERILNYYRQELKQDSNTLPDCNQQLIIRLVDFIRPIYSSQRKKLEDLDALIEDISVLQALPFIEQREKNEQLNNEILHLKKLIIKSAHEGDQSDNTMTKVYRISEIICKIELVLIDQKI